MIIILAIMTHKITVACSCCPLSDQSAVIRADLRYSNKKSLKTATSNQTFDSGHCYLFSFTESQVLNGMWVITIVAKCVMSLVCLFTRPCFLCLVCGLSWPPSTSHSPPPPSSWCSHLSAGSSSQPRLSLGHLSGFQSVRCGSPALPVWWILAFNLGGGANVCVGVCGRAEPISVGMA